MPRSFHQRNLCHELAVGGLFRRALFRTYSCVRRYRPSDPSVDRGRMIMFGISSRTATILSDSSRRQREGLCSDSLRSDPACALLRLRAMLAPAIALRRMLSDVFASSRVAGREEGRTNRRGQDKSRKVRPVVRSGNVSNFNHAHNIAKNWHTLPILPGRCSSSVFDTLR
jgi:hypothetical protein